MAVGFKGIKNKSRWLHETASGPTRGNFTFSGGAGAMRPAQKAQGGSGRFRNVDDGCQVILRCRAFPEAEAGYRWGTLVPVQGCPAADIELVQISGLGHVGPGHGLSGAILRNEHAVGSPCLNGESQ